MQLVTIHHSDISQHAVPVNVRTINRPHREHIMFFCGEAGASFARKLFEHKVDFCTNCSLIASWTDRRKASQRLILGLFGLRNQCQSYATRRIAKSGTKGIHLSKDVNLIHLGLRPAPEVFRTNYDNLIPNIPTT